MKQRLVLLTYAAAVALLPATVSAQTRDADRPPYRSPLDLAFSPDGGLLAVSDRTAGCARCHPRPLLTDLQVRDVGTKDQLDHTPSFDTPTLVELWRTGPYLHHGKARTLREVFTKFNRQDRHGKTSHLSKDELDALVAYLLSL